MHTCTCICVCTCVRRCICMSMHMHMCMSFICMSYVYVYVLIYIYVFVDVDVVWLYVYIYMYGYAIYHSIPLLHLKAAFPVAMFGFQRFPIICGRKMARLNTSSFPPRGHCSTLTSMKTWAGQLRERPSASRRRLGSLDGSLDAGRGPGLGAIQSSSPAWALHSQGGYPNCHPSTPRYPQW